MPAKNRASVTPRHWGLRRISLFVVSVLGIAPLLMLATPSVASAKKAPPLRYYVALGDSWTVGTDVTGPGAGPTSFAFPILAAKKMKMQLANFGCSGATTDQVLNGGCLPQYQAVNGPGYGGLTQLGAAVAFINSHVGQIGVISVQIGGNDLDVCATAADPVSCVTTVSATVQANVTEIVGQLRSAAGAAVPILGVTYMDPLLSYWVYPPINQLLAQLSVVAFSTYLNPALEAAYATANAHFVDVTSETGIYTSFTEKVHLSPFGSIPYPVAQVCKLTWGCTTGDGHPNLKGQKTLEKLVYNEWKVLPHP